MEERDCTFITLVDVTADEAAHFALWLRDSFVPAPDLVRFVSGLAMANGEETPGPFRRRVVAKRSWQRAGGTSTPSTSSENSGPAVGRTGFEGRQKHSRPRGAHALPTHPTRPIEVLWLP